ncbi:hypothetical protein [Nostoc sp.]|uniref:hypothetical protein n=1 Tax=Nostoc sp. TaxID=1180 RepID=UPI002FF84AE7
MANSYTNIIVKGQNQEVLLNYLERLRINAYVSPFIKDIAIVYAEIAENDSKELFSLASLISSQFNNYTLAVLNHDETVFHYELYECGKLVDQYISNPKFHDLEAEDIPKGGNAQKLCSAFEVTKAVKKVKAILEEHGEGIYLFSSERHKKLIKALKIPFFWATESVGGYIYIQKGAITPMREKELTPEFALSMLKKTKSVNSQNVFQIEAKSPLETLLKVKQYNSSLPKLHQQL